MRRVLVGGPGGWRPSLRPVPYSRLSCGQCSTRASLMGKRRVSTGQQQQQQQTEPHHLDPRQAAEVLALRYRAEVLTHQSQRKDVDHVLRALVDMRQGGVKLPVDVYKTIILGLKRAACYEGVTMVSTAMQEDGHALDINHYNNLLMAAQNSSRLQEATSIFKEMRDMGVAANRVTYSTMARVYRLLSDTNAILALLDMIASDPAIEPNAFVDVYGCLIDVMVDRGELTEVVTLVSKLPSKYQDQALYRRLIRPLAEAKDWEACVKLWRDMRVQDVMPDGLIFRSLIYALYRASQPGLTMQFTAEYAQLQGQGSSSLLPHGLKAAALRYIMVAAWQVGDHERALHAVEQLLAMKDRLEGRVLRAGLTIALGLEKDHLVQALLAQVDAAKRGSTHFENQLLSAYNALKRWEEADQLYATMKRRDEHTYKNMVLAAVCRGRIDRALSIMDEAIERKCFDHTGAGLVLAELSSKREWKGFRRILARARHIDGLPIWVFEQLAYSYATHGEWQEALKTLRTLESEGRRLTKRMYSTVIYGCAQAGQGKKASELLTEMEGKGIKPSVETHNVLLLAYSKVGDWRSAWSSLLQMKDKGVEPDIISFNTVIKAASAAGHWRFITTVLRRMEKEGVAPDIISYNSALLAFKGSENWRQAAELLREARSRGLSPDLVTYNTLVDIYAVGGGLNEAMSLLQEWQAEGMRPDRHAYTSIIRSAVRQQRWEVGWKLLEDMERQGIEHGPEDCDLRLAVLLGLGREEEAKTVFGSLKETFGNDHLMPHEMMIHGLIYAGRGSEAVEMVKRLVTTGEGPAVNAALFEEAFHTCRRMRDRETGAGLITVMREHDVEVNADCLASLAHFYAAQCNYEDGLATLVEIKDRGWRLNAGLYKSWLHMLGDKKDTNETMHALDVMISQGVYDPDCFAIALRSLSDAGDFQRCEDLLQKFAASSVTPSVTFSRACLHHAHKLGGLKKCLAKLTQLHKEGWPLNVSCWHVVLAAAVQEGDWRRTVMTFEKMRERRTAPDVSAYSYLITAYGHMDQLAAAIETFKSIENDGMTPNSTAYVAILTACARAGRADLAEEYFTEMEKARGLTPTLVMFNALLSAKAKAYGVAEAVKLLPVMEAHGIVPDTVSYNSIMGVCAEKEDWEGALQLLRAPGLRPDQVSYAFAMQACGMTRWPLVTYLYDEALACVDMDAGDRRHCLITFLEQLQSDNTCFDLFGRGAYRGIVADGMMDHWSKDKSAKRVLDVHLYTRAMARCAVAEVLDEVVRGEGPLEEGKHTLSIMTGRNETAGGSILRSDLIDFLRNMKPPLELVPQPGNSGRSAVDHVSFWRWTHAKREKEGLR